MDPFAAFDQVQQDQLYQDWQQHHHHYLTHFFCALDEQAQTIIPWEIGFMKKDKITVFTSLPDGTIIIKPADEVFKKQTDTVEELHLSAVHCTWEQAQAQSQKQFPLLYPKEQRGDGFVILQNWQGTTVWNFTFISKTFKFLNLKLNAQTGQIFEHQDIDLIQK